MQNKFTYYLRSIWTILTGYQNWPEVLGLFLGLSKGSSQQVHLKQSGLRFFVRNGMDAWIIKETCLDGDYDRLGSPVRDGWNVIDIGAGLGDYTIWAAHHAPHGKVYAYEPFHTSLELLQKNLVLNEIENVTVYAEAVSEQAGILHLEEIGEAVQHSTSTSTGKAVTHAVTAVTLKSALDRLDGGVCDLLKIDCEGAEYGILMKADPACWGRIKQIVLEYHDHVTAYSHTDLVRFFEDQGYAVRRVPNPVHQEIGFLHVKLDANHSINMKEPSVLDYVKSILMPWKGERIILPEPGEPAVFPKDQKPGSEAEDQAGTDGASILEPVRLREKIRPRFIFRTYLAVVLAVLAQSNLDTQVPHVIPAVVLYLLAGIFLIWALIVKEWQVAEISEDASVPMPLNIRLGALGFSIPLFVIAYISFANNKFSIYNVIIGLLLIAYMGYVFFAPRSTQGEATRSQFKFSWTGWDSRIHITPWHIVIVAAFIFVLFFRFYRIDSVPNEMISDHAEKLLDVGDVLAGQTSIFFPRNTGREAFQFYLTAMIAQLLGTGISFISLKIGTVTAGAVTLIFVYLLGKEAANQRVGLLAMVLTGIAYWPNVISRIGLRFALYPLFVAPLLYFLVRGLRRQNRNDFIWAGIALGIGLHGYSPMRIVPFVVLILILLYLLHRQADGKRYGALIGLAIVAGVSLAVLLPLVRYALEDPQNMAILGLRAFSRLGAPGLEYPGAPLQIFFSNLWNAWTMIFYDNGEIWAHSVPHRPALDLVSTVFYFAGTLVTVYQYIRTRHWIHLFLLVSVPLLMLPSILSLTFPGENPSLNRTGGAYVPVFILAAIGLEGFLVTLWAKVGTPWRSWVTIGATSVIILWASLLNYDLVFNQYANLYAQSSWNTSEMGEVAKGFTQTFGEESSVWVVAYPYWVDGRLVAINANQSRKDFSIFGDRLSTTFQIAGAKLFLLSAEDQKDLETLQQLYPDGIYTIRPGNYAKKFITFIVPGLALR